MKKWIVAQVIVVVVLTISTVIVNKENSREVIMCSLLTVLIPALYSIIPIIKEHLQEIHKRKNRLSDITFTDREEDIKSVFNKLSTAEHVIQIKGRNGQCGKTWLAKKVCDCINYPNKETKLIRCPYRKAFYIDMDNKSNEFLHDFFEKNIINNKCVLIFDHVTDLRGILSKQELFHFQLIYIMKEELCTEYFSHIVTEFGKEHINELHEKIRKNYPEIEKVSQEEINILYNLTGGNIGKIYTLLSREESITWIKNITEKKLTDYDLAIEKVNADLLSGYYEEAEKKLEIFYNQYRNILDTNNDLRFKYYFTKSDCEHLLNRYENALSTLAIVDSSDYNFVNSNYKVQLHQAHYYKHLWNSNKALEILYSIQKQSLAAMVDSFGILLAKYFIDDLTLPVSEHDSKSEFLYLFEQAESSSMPSNDAINQKINRYRVFYKFYSEMPACSIELLELVDKVIRIYKAQNNRLLANTYFLRGEIHRLYQNYNLAEQDYEQSILITKDDNIRIQVGIMRYYLYNIKKIDILARFEVLSLEDIIRLCHGKNIYGEKLFHRINCIKNGDPIAVDIIECFDNRIMTIL